MIEKAIHEILHDINISDAVDLSVMLAPSRMVTGLVQAENMALPYCTFNVESDQSEYRSNTSSLRNRTVRFQLWHDNHLSGTEIQAAIQKLFENKSFETPEAEILCSRHENSFTVQEDDGVWQFVSDFDVMIKERDYAN